MSGPIGVGFIGAGAVVQSIHLPTLARLDPLFGIVALWDPNADAAEAAACRAGARAVASLDALIGDPAVDVIAVCSPASFHAEHICAAMRAGKRAVFCEKPLATDAQDAALIAATAAETGVPLIVGAMHRYDPAWTRVAAEVAEMARDALSVRSSIVLPFNRRFEPWATEQPAPSIPPVAAPPAPPRTDAARLRNLVMELAIHDLPLVRALLPQGAPVTVTAAQLLHPVGYALTLRAGDRLVDLSGYINDQWAPRWELEAISATAGLHIVFTPSFLAAGSGVATVSRGGTVTTYPSISHNGYEGEWRAIAAVIAGEADVTPSLATLADDLSFALEIAAQAVALVEEKAA